MNCIFCSFRETLKENLTFNSTWQWTTLKINQCIADGNMVKFQLSGLKYEYIHFATVYSSKVQFGKQLSPLMLPSEIWAPKGNLGTAVQKIVLNDDSSFTINLHTRIYIYICSYVPTFVSLPVINCKIFLFTCSLCACSIHFVQHGQLVYVTACGLDLSGSHQKSGNQKGILELLFRNLCGSVALKVAVGCVMYVMGVAYPVAALWYCWIISL